MPPRSRRRNQPQPEPQEGAGGDGAGAAPEVNASEDLVNRLGSILGQMEQNQDRHGQHGAGAGSGQQAIQQQPLPPQGQATVASGLANTQVGLVDQFAGAGAMTGAPFAPLGQAQLQPALGGFQNASLQVCAPPMIALASALFLNFGSIRGVGRRSEGAGSALGGSDGGCSGLTGLPPAS